MTAARKPVQMAVLNIGYRQILLPAAKAMKVMELLQEAVEVDGRYSSLQTVYEVSDEPLVLEIKVVRANQIRMPHGVPEPAPAPRKPRLLR